MSKYPQQQQVTQHKLIDDDDEFNEPVPIPIKVRVKRSSCEQMIHMEIDAEQLQAYLDAGYERE